MGNKSGQPKKFMRLSKLVIDGKEQIIKSPEFPQRAVCPHCSGSGNYTVRGWDYAINNRCPNCKGTGKVPQPEPTLIRQIADVIEHRQMSQSSTDLALLIVAKFEVPQTEHIGNVIEMIAQHGTNGTQPKPALLLTEISEYIFAQTDASTKFSDIMASYILAKAEPIIRTDERTKHETIIKELEAKVKKLKIQTKFCEGCDHIIAEELEQAKQESRQQAFKEAIIFIESYLVSTVEPDKTLMYHIDEAEWKSVKSRLSHMAEEGKP